MWLLHPHLGRSLAMARQQVQHAARCSTVSGRVLAIRREDQSLWERRAPLSPSHVGELVRQGVKVLVQPSNRRAYPMQAYEQEGAIIQEDISEAPVIIGVKRMPEDLLEPYKTYVFFSHTIKAQEANMALLDAVLEKNIRLIDYEKMMDAKGKRVVAFGKYAGVAGMINILHGLGVRLLALGHHTPFMHIGSAHNYRNSESARQAIRDAGYEIALGNMPKSMGPLTFVFTGAGNVAKGAQEVFKELPHEYVKPEHLAKVARHGATDRIYATVVRRRHHLVRRTDNGFDPEEYTQHPERYASDFSVKIAPYASVIINGIYWAPGAPRFVTLPDAKNLLQPQQSPWLPSSAGCPQLPHRLLAICDISADPGGSIEFMQDCTSIDHPFVLYDAHNNVNKESFTGDGVLMCSIDNMPAQLPREATDFFGSLLINYLPDILASDARTPFNEYKVSPVVRNAVIASNGHLTPNYEYIADLRRKKAESKQMQQVIQSSKKKVLVLGSGYVSTPVIDYLSRDSSIAVTVASDVKRQIDHLAELFPNTTPVLVDVGRNQEELRHLINDHNIVISLLPYTLHPEIAKMCIKAKVHLVTASYLSPAMQALHKAAQEAGITVMNEVGVDPGIDHLLAMECFDDVREHGGKVTSFTSWCGGLPAPHNCDNPLRYKFNWSPRAVLFNLLSGCKYVQDGKVVEVAGGGELLNAVRDIEILPGFRLEGYPNRDSTGYLSLYGIESASSILRGTLRYKGFTDAAKGLLQLGLLSADAHPMLHQAGPDVSWRSLISEFLGKRPDILFDSLKDLVYDRVERSDRRLKVIQELGLLSETLVDKKNTPLETLSHYLAHRLAYNEGETDILIMRHDIGVLWPDRRQEMIHIDLVQYGDSKKYTAMAATVGFPTAIATKMILEGEIQSRGMMLPFAEHIYRPMLSRLADEGIKAKRRTTTLVKAVDSGPEQQHF